MTLFRYYLGFILRFLTGVFHAPTFPTLQGMWTQWAPKQEKSRLVCAHFMGVPSGSVLISLIGGKLGGDPGGKLGGTLGSCLAARRGGSGGGTP